MNRNKTDQLWNVRHTWPTKCSSAVITHPNELETLRIVCTSNTFSSSEKSLKECDISTSPVGYWFPVKEKYIFRSIRWILSNEFVWTTYLARVFPVCRAHFRYRWVLAEYRFHRKVFGSLLRHFFSTKFCEDRNRLEMPMLRSTRKLNTKSRFSTSFELWNERWSSNFVVENRIVHWRWLSWFIYL